MSQIKPLSHRALFHLRRAFRAGKLYAVLDATGYPNLLASLGASGLWFESLFSGEDAIMLSGEAPYIVSLDPANPQAVRDLLQAADNHHAGFVAQSDAGLDDLRRHFAGHLHVIINEGRDMALFRFYDTRVLLAFLGTLSATDAAAFWGPVSQAFVATHAGAAQVRMPVLPNSSGMNPAPAAGQAQPPGMVRINSDQMAQLAKVTDAVFRARLADYLTTEWAEDAAGMTPQDVEDLVAAAIGDCSRLEVCREMDVVIMSIARLRLPDMVASDEFWQAVIEQRPNPNQRAGAFLGRMIAGLDDEANIAFYRRVNGWWQFGKELESADP